MTELLYLLTIILPLGTILLVFGMKYISAGMQARARMDGESTYRALAEKAVAAQADNSAPLAAMQTDLAEIKARLATIEKVLKEVE